MIALILLCFLAVWFAAALSQRKFNYEIGTNDCRHMSLNQARIFRKLGMDVHFWLAELEGEKNHVFLKLTRLELPWQPESLLPIPSSIWFENYDGEREITIKEIDLPQVEINELLGVKNLDLRN